MESSEEGSTTLEDLGFHPRTETHESVFGKVRMWASLSKLEVAFIVLTTLSILGTMALCFYKLATINPNEDSESKEDFAFAIVLIINCSFCIVYVFHGVLWERPYELVVYVGGTLLVTVYLTVNFVHTAGWNNDIKIVRLVAAGVLAPVTISIGVLLARSYFETGSLIFRTVGASAELQSTCQLLYINEALVKFDLQAAASMLTLVLNGTKMDLKQVLALSLGCPFSVFWQLLGVIALRFENRIGSYIFLALSVIEPAYVIYLFQQTATASTTSVVTSVTYACGAVALILRAAVVICSVFVIRNFNIGLRDKLLPRWCLNTRSCRDTQSSEGLADTNA